MALINCLECGKQISDKATVCPHCGCPIASRVKCPECSTMVKDTATSCPNCGYPLSGKKNKPKSVSKPRKIKWGSVIQFLIYAAIIGGAIAIVCMKERDRRLKENMRAIRQMELQRQFGH